MHLGAQELLRDFLKKLQDGMAGQWKSIRGVPLLAGCGSEDHNPSMN
jgi:hypothetical protein